MITEQSNWMDSIKEYLINETLPQDKWVWSLKSTCDFSATPARVFIDKHTLYSLDNHAWWNRTMPIKVDIMVWHLILNKFHSKVNIVGTCLNIVGILCV